jgi:thymidine kinase
MPGIEIIIGSMFSGKSSELMRRVDIQRALGKRVLILNHSSDNRYSTTEEIVTHSRRRTSCVKTDSISLVASIMLDFDIIAIDEFHFFDTDAVSIIIEKCRNIKFIIAGLHSDYRQQKIGHILELVPSADSVTCLRALCIDCSHTSEVLASFTVKKNAGSAEKQIDVGGSDKYKAVCRNCQLKHTST